MQLLDGPCQGHYLVKRAPMYLRAVKDESSGECDVLDLLEDTPKLNEKVFIYKLQDGIGTAHIDGRDKNGHRFGGWYAMGDYKWLPEVDGESYRDNDVWKAWVIETWIKEQQVEEKHGA